MNEFLQFKDQKGRFLVPFSNGFNLEIKLDYQGDKFTVIDPYTEIVIEKINGLNLKNGGIPFFNCPKCTQRVRHVYVDYRDDEVCCKYCMSLKEIDMNEE